MPGRTSGARGGAIRRALQGDAHFSTGATSPHFTGLDSRRAAVALRDFRKRRHQDLRRLLLVRSESLE
jgi:hypothetical protein